MLNPAAAPTSVPGTTVVIVLVELQEVVRALVVELVDVEKVLVLEKILVLGKVLVLEKILVMEEEDSEEGLVLMIILVMEEEDSEEVLMMIISEMEEEDSEIMDVKDSIVLEISDLGIFDVAREMGVEIGTRETEELMTMTEEPLILGGSTAVAAFTDLSCTIGVAAITSPKTANLPE